ncbi:palmitoyltransferase ZDHHC2 isoform X2 [Onthophagus taurus]|uniref:palmitoyltransferase ZDHHC2 isoform X2 n=1 Tax=Onthophagus taurus TaxID=166361 RepID=UPI000C1FE637|nr:palmitoyltransferase ZDHHC15 isoform X2 [Onthophagus taurus]
MAVPGNNQRESCCVRVFKWIPVLFILSIVFWSYYAYIIQLCILTIEDVPKQIIYIFVYHCIYAMFLWAYWQTVLTPSGRVPDKFRLSEVEYDRILQAENEETQRLMLEDFSRNLPNLNRTVSGSVRYCEKCRLVKPDRTHHCSVCGRCILKMDHHCPWVNNCIGFTNYKFFVLFLGYALIYCIYVALTSVQYFIKFWHGTLEGTGRFHILFLFFVALMFAISLVSLFCYHCYLVLQNRTTLEAFRAPIFQTGPDKQGFDLGKYNNFREIFGVKPKLWILPIPTSLGDGVAYPTHLQHQSHMYHSMESTQTRSD